jgi:hypothetical protein
MFTSWEVKQLCEYCNQEQNVKVSIAGHEEIEQPEYRRDFGESPGHNIGLLHKWHVLLFGGLGY